MAEISLTEIAVRISIMYLYALALVRLSGKQSIGQLTGMDFVTALIIGDVFDNVFYGEAPVVQGVVAFAAVILIHLMVTLGSSRNKRFYRLVTSVERQLIKNGRLVPRILPASLCPKKTKACLARESPTWFTAPSPIVHSLRKI